VGVFATLAVALHEVPRELGSFGVLVHGGLSPRRALAVNTGTALLAGVGAAGTLALGAAATRAAHALLPFAAGSFLYVSGALLLPLLASGAPSGARRRRGALAALGVAVTAGAGAAGVVPAPQTRGHQADARAGCPGSGLPHLDVGAQLRAVGRDERERDPRAGRERRPQALEHDVARAGREHHGVAGRDADLRQRRHVRHGVRAGADGHALVERRGRGGRRPRAGERDRGAGAVDHGEVGGRVRPVGRPRQAPRTSTPPAAAAPARPSRAHPAAPNATAPDARPPNATTAPDAAARRAAPPGRAHAAHAPHRP
jgi:hypothetical protein